MGFDDLEAAEREHNERAAEDEQTDDASSAGEFNDTPASTATDSTADADTADADAAALADEPAFEFGDVKQSPMYARPPAWAALEDALDLEVVRALREAGIRNEEKRELHDAALRVAAEHPDEIAEAVKEARRAD